MPFKEFTINLWFSSVIGLSIIKNHKTISLIKETKILKIFFLFKFSNLLIKTPKKKGKKKITGSQIKHNIGNTIKLYNRDTLSLYLLDEKFKNNKKPIKINNSFLARTSISATG